jgi:TonB family protein
VDVALRVFLYAIVSIPSKFQGARKFFRRAPALGAILLLAATSAFAQQPDVSKPSEDTGANPVTTPGATSSTATIPSYPNSTKGLENLVKEMLKLEKEGDQKELAEYARSLALPNPDNWFKSVFGDDLGSQLVVVSGPMRAGLEANVPHDIETQLNEKRTDVEAVRFDKACNSRTTDIEYPFLLLRQREEPLYDVRFVGTDAASVWAYFAYVDGGFRFIGNLRKGDTRPPPRPRGDESSEKRIQVGGQVTAAKLVHQVLPTYPDEAKSEHIQGTVVLHAIIGKDGSVRDLQLISGNCFLVESAMDAVKHWRYSPTLLAGSPVEVDTTIQVVYALGSR